jgi:hypothetical protein
LLLFATYWEKDEPPEEIAFGTGDCDELVGGRRGPAEAREVPFIESLQIFVKTVSGKTLVFQLDECEQVKKVLELVQEKDNVPPNMQRMTDGGKPLETGRTSGLQHSGRVNVVGDF